MICRLKILFISYGIIDLISLILQITQVLKRKKKYNKLLDRDLVRLYKSETDKNAIGELFNRYAHLVASIALGILKNEQKATDTVHSIFKSIIVDIQNNDIKNFNAWIYSVTKSKCFQVKNNKVLNGLESKDDLNEILEKKLLLQNLNLKKYLKKINPNQKECIELYYNRGMSYSEISERLGMSLKEAKSLISDGKKHIQLLINNNEAN